MSDVLVMTSVKERSPVVSSSWVEPSIEYDPHRNLVRNAVQAGSPKLFWKAQWRMERIRRDRERFVELHARATREGHPVAFPDERTRSVTQALIRAKSHARSLEVPLKTRFGIWKNDKHRFPTLWKLLRANFIRQETPRLPGAIPRHNRKTDLHVPIDKPEST